MRRIALIRVSTLYHFSAKLRNYFKLKPNFGVEFLDAISSRTLCVSILYVRIVAHESVWLRMVVKWGFIGHPIILNYLFEHHQQRRIITSNCQDPQWKMNS